MDGVTTNLAQTIVPSLMTELVIPCFKSFANKAKLDYKKNLVPTEKHFREYFSKTYNRLSTLNTIALKNTKKSLKEIYIPLSLVSRGERKSKRVKITSYPKSLMNTHKNILVTDTAGMGKSTLMKKIFLDIVDKHIGIPLFIELRRLSKDKSLFSEISEQLSSLSKKFDQGLLLALLAEGGFIIILDGYDEIAINDKAEVTSDIQKFILEMSKNNFIMTSRPEQSLSGFNTFVEFNIEPLKKEEAFKLLKKYDKSNKISSLLINKLEETNLSGISEYLTNPLLVSLLFTAFEYKQKIPLKKHLFYRQVFDAYFEMHDITKGDSFTHDRYTNLGTDDFERILRYLGFLCLKKQKIEFSKDELLAFLDECKRFCVGINFQNDDFVKDITTMVPLFTRDSIYYKWSHKSLQEYFAAQFIYRDSGKNRDDLLLKIYQNPNVETFENVLDLYYDIDYKTFRNVVKFQFVKEYIEYSSANLVGEMRCCIGEKELIRRSELLFGRENVCVIKTQVNKIENGEDDVAFKKALSKMNGRTFDAYPFTKIIQQGEKVVHEYSLYIFCQYIARILTVSRILANKQSSLVRVAKGNKDVFNILELDEFNKLYPLNNDIYDELNKKDNYQIINEGLEVADFLFRGNIIPLNHVNIYKMYDEISNDLIQEDANDSLMSII